jgi:polysaccharide biosynthesis transport protein
MTEPPFSNEASLSGRSTSYFVSRALRKHWLLGTIVVVAVITGTIFYTVGETRIYRATATIQIDPNPPRPLGKDVQAVVDMGSGSFWSNKEYYTTQQKILEGRGVARETARTLNLQRDASFMGRANKGQNGRDGDQDSDLEQATSLLASRLKVEPVTDSRLLVVNYNDPDAQRARRILATLIEGYLERNIDLVVASTGAATEWLRDQLEKLKYELEKSEMALHEFKKEKQILSVSLDDQSNMLRGEMQQLNDALTHVNTHREEIEARSRELDKIDSDDPTTLPATELLNNALLGNLRSSYITAKSELSSLLGKGKGENHPEVEAIEARVEITRQALMNEVRNIQGAVRADLVAVGRESQGVSGLFEHAKRKAMDLNMLEIEYRRLERTKANTEKLYGLVLERSKESDLTGMMRFNNISVVERPTVPRKPYRPRIPLNMAVGLMAGLVMGMLTAMGREFADQTIRSPQDVEWDIEAPLLGLLPMVSAQSNFPTYYSHRRRSKSRKQVTPLTSPELLVHDLPSSNAAECARNIRTSLIFSSPDKPHRTILVTSGSPGEGKTTIACTIAIALSQIGQRILLVDCDLRRARLHRIFHLENTVGVSTVLQDPSNVDTAIRESSVPNLWVLTAGPHVPNPAELVQSDSFKRMLHLLGQKFDRVILDSPPVMAVTDASVIATRVDATVLVARAGKTRRDVARQVVRKLNDLGAPILGIVLNALVARGRKGGYYYYSYSYYGQQYGDSTTTTQV